MARQIKTFDPTSGLDVLQLIAKLLIRLVEMAAKKGASAAAKKRVLAVRKGATWGK